MANKTTFSALVPSTLGKRMALGDTDTNAISAGFLVVGKSTGGTEILKPVSKAEFVKSAMAAGHYETKSQAAKGFYANLGTFTMAARSDFNANLDKGFKVMARRSSESGRMTYTLAQPKADTGGATVNAKLQSENAELKARLAKLEKMILAASEAAE